MTLRLQRAAGVFALRCRVGVEVSLPMVHTCYPGVCLRLELMVLASALHRALVLAEQEGLQTACIPGACDGEDRWC